MDGNKLMAKKRITKYGDKEQTFFFTTAGLYIVMWYIYALQSMVELYSGTKKKKF
jgi:hypothetical protein